jgi:hypothetical protein
MVPTLDLSRLPRFDPFTIVFTHYGSVLSTSTAVLQYTPDSQWVETGDFTEALHLLYWSSTSTVVVQGHHTLHGSRVETS